MVSTADIIDIASIVLIVASAIIIHECAHGWVAYRLGDSTAKDAGRLTLNPLKHIDPIGTVVLPGILIILRWLGMNSFVFGWAKPVPIDPRKFRHPRRDMMWVGLAGPVSNVGIAFFLSLLIRGLNNPALNDIFAFGIYVNILLAVFNMIPIPPLDGSRIVMGVLPKKLAFLYARMEGYGIVVVFVLMYFNLLDKYIIPVVSAICRWFGV